MNVIYIYTQICCIKVVEHLISYLNNEQLINDENNTTFHDVMNQCIDIQQKKQPFVYQNF